METYSTTEIIRLLQTKQLSLFTLTDFGKLFKIENQQTLYKKIQRLEKDKIIQKLIKGKYRFLLSPTDDFTIANFLYQPSYLSLESALSFYGITAGFTYQITSISVKKSKTVEVDNQEFRYSQIGGHLFWGYEKRGNFLIAEKEKAILDYIYFGLKGLRSLSFDEFDLTEINKQKFVIYAKGFNNKKIHDYIRTNKKFS